LAWLSMVLAWVYGSSAFVVERIKIKKMKMQTWAIPRYNFQVNGCFYWLCLYMMVCKVLTVFVITVWPELGERVNQRLN
jgi:uncharacterized membrane protein